MLGDVERDDGVPPHWVPMHGDFAPWNVRRLSDGRVAVLDWENLAWAPPNADSVYYRMTAAALFGGRVRWHGDDAEAREYWLEVLSGREPDTTSRDEKLRADMLGALEGAS